MMRNASALPASGRRTEVDVAKGVAMLMVILTHYNQSFKSNIRFFEFFQMGCQVFFVVAGFGTAMSFSRKRNSMSGKQATISFFKSRLKAIAPAWYFMLFVTYIVNSLLLMLVGETMPFGENRQPLSILCNVLFIHGAVPFCNNNVMPGGWYIGTLMILYLISPLLFYLMVAAKTLPRKRACCFGLSAISLLVICLLGTNYPEKVLQNNSFGYYSALTQLPCYVLGFLLFFEIDANTEKRAAGKGLLGLILMVCAVVLFFYPATEYAYILDACLVGLATFLLLQWIMGSEKGTLYRKLEKPLGCIGRKTLYVYLVHGYFAWTFVRALHKVFQHFGINDDNYLSFLVLAPVVIAASYYFGKAVEKIVAILCSSASNYLKKVQIT